VRNHHYPLRKPKITHNIFHLVRFIQKKSRWGITTTHCVITHKSAILILSKCCPLTRTVTWFSGVTIGFLNRKVKIINLMTIALLLLLYYWSNTVITSYWMEWLSSWSSLSSSSSSLSFQVPRGICQWLFSPLLHFINLYSLLLLINRFSVNHFSTTDPSGCAV